MFCQSAAFLRVAFRAYQREACGRGSDQLRISVITLSLLWWPARIVFSDSSLILSSKVWLVLCKLLSIHLEFWII